VGENPLYTSMFGYTFGYKIFGFIETIIYIFFLFTFFYFMYLLLQVFIAHNVMIFIYSYLIF